MLHSAFSVRTAGIGSLEKEIRMANQEAKSYGREKARQVIDQMVQELNELCAPYSMADTERFWSGFIQELQEQYG